MGLGNCCVKIHSPSNRSTYIMLPVAVEIWNVMGRQMFEVAGWVVFSPNFLTQLATYCNFCVSHALHGLQLCVKIYRYTNILINCNSSIMGGSWAIAGGSGAISGGSWAIVGGFVPEEDGYPANDQVAPTIIDFISTLLALCHDAIVIILHWMSLMLYTVFDIPYISVYK